MTLSHYGLAAAAAAGMLGLWWAMADDNRAEQAAALAADGKRAAAVEMLHVASAAQRWSQQPANESRYGEVPAGEMRLTQVAGESYSPAHSWRTFYGPVTLSDGRSGWSMAVMCLDDCVSELATSGVGTADVVNYMLEHSQAFPGAGWANGATVSNPRSAAAAVPLPAAAAAAAAGRQYPVMAQVRLNAASDGAPYAAVMGGRTEICSLVPTGVCPDAAGKCAWYVNGGNSDPAGNTVCPSPGTQCPAGYSGDGKVFRRTAVYSDRSSARGVPAWRFGAWSQVSEDCWHDVPYSETRSCSSGYNGTTSWARTVREWTDGRTQVIADWAKTAEDCWRDTAASETRACGAGFTGSTTWSRTVRTWTDGRSQVVSDWTQTGGSCTAVPVCPAGTTGTPPDCVTETGVLTCPADTIGSPPNCIPTLPSGCPAGTTGSPPNCVPIAPPALACSCQMSALIILNSQNTGESGAGSVSSVTDTAALASGTFFRNTNQATVCGETCPPGETAFFTCASGGQGGQSTAPPGGGSEVGNPFSRWNVNQVGWTTSIVSIGLLSSSPECH